MSEIPTLYSGLWVGMYEQSRHEYPQKMTLEFADGLMRGDGADDLGTFAIVGEYRAEGGAIRMGWIKTYDQAHSVLYLGTYEGVEVRGKWDIQGYRGGFALSPKPGMM